MGWFGTDKHDLPKGTVDRSKGSQKGVRARDHQKGALNFSDVNGGKTRSWLFGAPNKHGGKR